MCNSEQIAIVKCDWEPAGDKKLKHGKFDEHTNSTFWRRKTVFYDGQSDTSGGWSVNSRYIYGGGIPDP